MGIEAIYNWWVVSNMFQILGIFPLSSRMIKSLFGEWLSYAELSTLSAKCLRDFHQCGYPKSSTGLAWRKGMTWFRLKPPFYAVLCPSMASARDTQIDFSSTWLSISLIVSHSHTQCSSIDTYKLGTRWFKSRSGKIVLEQLNKVEQC